MAKIQLMEDEGCEMVRIDVDSECKFEGNFRDLPSTTGTGLSDLLDMLGVEHELSEYAYDE